MTDNNSAGRIEPPLAGTEAETLAGSLNRQRATFAWKQRVWKPTRWP